MNARIWCEFTPPSEVCRDYVLELFRKYDITLNYKLEYGRADEDFFRMLETYNREKLPVSIWATLSDDMGYWINEKNALHFDRYVRELVKNIEERGLAIKGFCIDMESPLEDIKRIASPKGRLEPLVTYGKMITGNLSKKRYAEAMTILRGTAGFLRQKGLEGYATCVRHCYYDLRFGSEIMQNALEIPVFGIDWDKYNLMYYATMIRQELKAVKRVNVDYLIYHQVSYLAQSLRDKLAVSVGVTNIGKLGNEPYYESMEEFAKDIGILKECGVEDFSLFSLDGIMEEKRLEQFLHTMKEAKPCKPDFCHRVVRNEALSKGLMDMLKLYYRLVR